MKTQRTAALLAACLIAGNAAAQMAVVDFTNLQQSIQQYQQMLAGQHVPVLDRRLVDHLPVDEFDMLAVLERAIKLGAAVSLALQDGLDTLVVERQFGRLDQLVENIAHDA